MLDGETVNTQAQLRLTERRTSTGKKSSLPTISSEASIGGEAWFGPNNSVTINAGSGRFGDAAGITRPQWDATAKLWESLGYKVDPVPFGKR